MSELEKKIQRSLKILRMYRGDDPIEVSYSGGKDSDVILALTKMAGIPYRAIYKNTTIDPPYTVQHCKHNGVLDWSDKDVAAFINAHGIKCHPLYYNEQGKFCVERRLGCVGCPMQSDNGVADFKQYPKMLRQWITAGKAWWNKERERELLSKEKFGNIYALVAHNLFFDDYDSFQAANTSMFGKEDWKQRLEDFFKIEL